jgi:hypothetical protein
MTEGIWNQIWGSFVKHTREERLSSGRQWGVIEDVKTCYGE